MRRRLAAVSLALCVWWLGGCGENVFRPGYDRYAETPVECVTGETDRCRQCHTGGRPELIAAPPDSMAVVTVMSVDGDREDWVSW